MICKGAIKIGSPTQIKKCENAYSPVGGTATLHTASPLLLTNLGPGERLVGEMIVHHSVVLVLKLTSCSVKGCLTVKIALLSNREIKQNLSFSVMRKSI